MTQALRRRPLLALVVVVMSVHTLWLGIYIALGHESRDLINIGRYWVGQSAASPDIRIDPEYEYPVSRDTDFGRFRGYDGQFYYFIALDPRRAHHYMDAPRYRYSRILYPAAVWALAAGRDELVPYSMIIVNWLAAALGTIAVALILRRRGASIWWAAAFGLAPGMLLCLQRDLTEPLAYALAAGGLLALTGTSRHRFLMAGLAFGLAALARQTTLVIPAVWALWTLFGWGPGDRDPLGTRLWRAIVLTGLSTLPYLTWLVVLRKEIPPGGDAGRGPVALPYGWLFERAFELSRQPPMILAVAVPATIWALYSLFALLRRHAEPEWAAIALQVLVFVIFAPPYNAYTSLGRAVLGIVLVAVIAIPFVQRLPRHGRRALLAAGALYLAMTPVVFLYGLTA